MTTATGTRGDALRLIRTAAGFSQTAVATRAGISQKTLSAFERGDTEPDDFRNKAVIHAVVGLINDQNRLRGAAA